MCPRTIKVVSQYFLGLIVITFFVVLLTFIFSFLGAIFCSALAGMMLGAFKNLRWQSIPISFLFPLVSTALLRGMRAELADRQIFIVALVCFAVFWLTYLVAASLFLYERKGQDRARGEDVGSPAIRSAATGAGAANGEGLVTLAPRRELTLRVLQGQWSCETDGDEVYHEKMLDIQAERLTLRAADSKGQICVLASARVRLVTLGSLPTLVLCEGAEAYASDTLVSI